MKLHSCQCKQMIIYWKSTCTNYVTSQLGKTNSSIIFASQNRTRLESRIWLQALTAATNYYLSTLFVR